MMNIFLRSLLGDYVGRTIYMDADPGGGGGQGDPPGGQGEGNQAGTGDPLPNSLEELFKKNPALKTEYEATLQTHLGKRLKKYENVDPEEYKRLKAEEERKKQEELTDTQKLELKLQAMEAERTTLAEKERDISIKEYAIDNGLDPKLISRLVDKSSIKPNDSGQFEGIAEAVEQIKTEFPQLFQEQQEPPGGNYKPPTYKTPGQTGNPPTPKDPKEAGKAKALARHNKQN